jgi:hypothetical protein
MSTDDKSGPPIRDELAARAKLRKENMERWFRTQGAKIKAARPQAVYDACVLMAMEWCGRKAWDHYDPEKQIVTYQGLGPDQVKACEMRALSSSRARMFGNLPQTNEEWDSQIESVRLAWAQPVEKAA